VKLVNKKYKVSGCRTFDPLLLLIEKQIDTVKKEKQIDIKIKIKTHIIIIIIHLVVELSSPSNPTFFVSTHQAITSQSNPNPAFSLPTQKELHLQTLNCCSQHLGHPRSNTRFVTLSPSSTPFVDGKERNFHARSFLPTPSLTMFSPHTQVFI
jgi:hypothetical protein